MKKIILVVLIVCCVSFGCLGKRKGVIILKNDHKIHFDSFVLYDHKSYFVADGDSQYLVSRKDVKKINMEE